MANLINKTFFVGELNIPTNNVNVEPKLDIFIQKYESAFLRGIMGRKLYTAFEAGLIADPQEQRMLNLLFGTNTYDGLISSLSGASLNIIPETTKSLVVGRGNEYDPITGASTVILDPLFVGTPFVFSQRSIGQLVIGTEYTVAGNVLTLLNGAKFLVNDTFFLNKELSFEIAPGVTGVKSIIANYVYFKYINNEESQNVGIGVVVTKTENARRVTGMYRTVSAMHECKQGVEEFFDFIKSSSVYPEFDKKAAHKFYCNEIKGVNTLNI